MPSPAATTPAVFALTLAVAVCPARAQITLTEHTAASGLTATHMPDLAGIPYSQYTQTGGMAVGDFNQDGCPDLFWLGGGLTPDKLFINACDGSGTFTDQAAAWGVAVLHTGSGAAVGDYNNDGLPDIYVTSFGQPGVNGDEAGSHRLYRNDGGSFTEVAVAAGVNQTCQAPEPPFTISAGYGAAWGDYDLDGDLDLAVASWWGGYEGTRLFRNESDGTFTDVTETALGSAVDGEWGFQPAFVDMDGDRYPELLIASDFGTSRYLVNNADGTFTDATVASGTGLDDNGMGQTVADFNNDGVLDWYVTSIHKDVPQPGNYVGNTLYLCVGTHQFQEVSVERGCNDGGWGWGTIAVDFDQDTWTDIIEINGRAGGGEWQNEQGYLYRNTGDAYFEEVAMASGFDFVAEGVAIVALDVEPDGDLDVVAFANSGPLKYFRNDTAGGNWLQVSFDTSTNPLLAPDGYGTKATAYVSPNAYVRYLSGSPSYLATSEPLLHWGLGDATTVDQLTIEWSRGYVTTLQDVAVNQHLVIEAPGVGDIDANGAVDTVDFLMLLGSWGPCAPAPAACTSDLNGDGTVDTVDFLMLLGNWG